MLSKYIPPIKAPFNNPFFFIFILPIELPINMLIAVITIITGVIKDSLILVYVNIIENTNKIISEKLDNKNEEIRLSLQNDFNNFIKSSS